MKTIRIGSGAGFAGDRLTPALEIMEKGRLDYITFECLAERTIAIAQEEKIFHPERGYDSLLEYRMEKVLPLAYAKKIKVITDMGAANPVGAAKKAAEIAQRQGLHGLRIAAATGDDIKDSLHKFGDSVLWETGEKLSEFAPEIISANAYMGAEPIIEALANGADVVITGRVADPALFLGPLLYEFGWELDDWNRLGKGTLTGHLMECGAQVCGGYYADPGKKDVPDLDKLGFPIAEVSENGDFFITKAEGTGGCVTRDTCIEQLIYEIHDPARYLTPNVIADFSHVQFEEIAENVVKVTGASGNPKPAALKASIGYRDCYVGEGEISYGGSGAADRARLAAAVVTKRLESAVPHIQELKVDYIGMNSTYWNRNKTATEPDEVRLRIAGRTDDEKTARLIGQEVEALYTNGPAGGGGVRKSVKKITSIASVLVDREAVKWSVEYEEVR